MVRVQDFAALGQASNNRGRVDEVVKNLKKHISVWIPALRLQPAGTRFTGMTTFYVSIKLDGPFHKVTENLTVRLEPSSIG